jgi:hypothetical protein
MIEREESLELVRAGKAYIGASWPDGHPSMYEEDWLVLGLTKALEAALSTQGE